MTASRRLAPLLSAALLFALAFGSSLVPPPLGSPKLAFFASILVYALIVVAIPPLRRSVGGWLRLGDIDRRVVSLTAAVSLISVAGLVVYAFAVHPDVSDLRTQLPRDGGATLVLVGVAVALVNAATEEVVYRGVLLHALESEFGPGLLALLLQAVAFGTPHFAHGYPRGWVGLALTSGYGLLLGSLRTRARGLVAPFVAHVVADLTILAIVVHATR